MTLNEIVDIVAFKHKSKLLTHKPKYIAFNDQPINSDLDKHQRQMLKDEIIWISYKTELMEMIRRELNIR